MPPKVAQPAASPRNAAQQKKYLRAKARKEKEDERRRSGVGSSSAGASSGTVGEDVSEDTGAGASVVGNVVGEEEEKKEEEKGEEVTFVPQFTFAESGGLAVPSFPDPTPQTPQTPTKPVFVWSSSGVFAAGSTGAAQAASSSSSFGGPPQPPPPPPPPRASHSDAYGFHGTVDLARMEVNMYKDLAQKERKKLEEKQETLDKALQELHAVKQQGEQDYNKIVGLEGKITGLEADVAKLRADIKTVNREDEIKAAQIKKLENEIGELNEKATQREADLSNRSKTVSEQNEDKKKLADLVNALRIAKESADQRTVLVNNDLQKALAEVETLTEQNDSLSAEITARDDEKQAEDAERAEDMETLQQQIDNIGAELKAVETAKSDKADEILQLQRNLGDLEEQLNHVKAQNTELRQQMSAGDESRDKGDGASSILSPAARDDLASELDRAASDDDSPEISATFTFSEIYNSSTSPIEPVTLNVPISAGENNNVSNTPASFTFANIHNVSISPIEAVTAAAPVAPTAPISSITPTIELSPPSAASSPSSTTSSSSVEIITEIPGIGRDRQRPFGGSLDSSDDVDDVADDNDHPSASTAPLAGNVQEFDYNIYPGVSISPSARVAFTRSAISSQSTRPIRPTLKPRSQKPKATAPPAYKSSSTQTSSSTVRERTGITIPFSWLAIIMLLVALLLCCAPDYYYLARTRALWLSSNDSIRSVVHASRHHSQGHVGLGLLRDAGYAAVEAMAQAIETLEFFTGLKTRGQGAGGGGFLGFGARGVEGLVWDVERFLGVGWGMTG